MHPNFAFASVKVYGVGWQENISKLQEDYKPVNSLAWFCWFQDYKSEPVSGQIRLKKKKKNQNFLFFSLAYCKMFGSNLLLN